MTNSLQKNDKFSFAIEKVWIQSISSFLKLFWIMRVTRNFPLKNVTGDRNKVKI